MLILALTGSIATGKSTAANIITSPPHNLPLIDCDLLAREAVFPNTRAFRQILSAFGEDLVVRDLETGRLIGLNRNELGKRIFGNEAARKKLNSIVHPAVRWLIVKNLLYHWLLLGTPVVVVDVPLLFESHLSLFCSQSILIACDPEIQFNRLRQRDAHLSEDDVLKRISSQWPMEEKIKRADVVVWNNSGRDELALQLATLIESKWKRGKIWTWIMRVPLIGSIWAAWIVLKRWVISKELEREIQKKL